MIDPICGGLCFCFNIIEWRFAVPFTMICFNTIDEVNQAGLYRWQFLLFRKPRMRFHAHIKPPYFVIAHLVYVQRLLFRLLYIATIRLSRDLMVEEWFVGDH